ncbi:MAG: hypothetical protein D6771_00295 [Zetaproteobacteria bacterium]|nr:MAG: hypothetical protein D6771_00295 [Zetaproteobacteria bacterium]
MKRWLGWLAVALSVALAWLAWHPPAPPEPSEIFVPLPPPLRADADRSRHLWRVVTQRIVWKAAADALRARLAEIEKPQTIVRREEVLVHAFDDPRSFTSFADAIRAQNEWRALGVEATVVKIDDEQAPYRVALGRFYLAAYAEQMQARLLKLGRPFAYERRTIKLRTWRFTFPPLPRREAEALWRRVKALGVADPILIREDRFQKMFGASLVPEAAGS